MKRIFTLVLILTVGSLFSQTTIFSEDFTSPTFSSTSDWFWDNSGFYPNCNVAGSSGNSKFVGQQSSSGTFEETGSNSSINTSTFVNIQVSWNMIRATSSTPVLTFQWSNDAGNTWNTVSYTTPTVTAAWAAVPSVTLPSTASGTLISIRFTYTSVGGFADYVGIDDILVSGTPSPSYYWNGVGALQSVGSWGTNTNGTGANPPDFTTANQNFYLRNASTAALTAAWTISGTNSVLNIGDGSVGNQINLTIPSGFALAIGSGAKLNVTNNSTLTIQNTSFPALSSMVLGSNSTINFAQSAAVTIWATTYGSLVFSGSGNRNQASGTTVVGGAFTIGASNNYVLVNSPGSVTELSGQITCNGNITGGVSNITIDGSSSNSIGTLNFNGSGAINNLVLNRSGQTLTLGSNLSFSGILSQTTQFINGSVNLNGKSMTFGGPVTFPVNSSNGAFIGSATSSLTISGSGTITNDLIMDQGSAANKTLGSLTMNRGTNTLVLGSNLTAVVSVFTNGNLDLNGNLLTLSGAITFPAASSNGVFTGSSTSSLVISGSGAITNNLLMDQTSGSSSSLGDFFTLRNLATIVLGSNLTVAGTASLTLGILDINGNSLELSGPITFPSSATNKGFNGSLTSSLTIDGAGAISSSLFMSQTSATTAALAALTLNRASATLNVGNTLETYGTVLVTQGTLGAGGNLFLRSDANNKGSLGPVGGGVSGNIKVETFAAGGTTGWTNLGPSGVNNLSVSSWEGQIPMSCINCPNGPTSAGGYFVSIQGWDETAVASSTTAYLPMSYADPLSVGTGYWVFLGTALNTTADMTWTVLGTPVIGPVSIPLTNSGAGNGNGYNLISNPFPSPISWSSLLLANPTSSVDDAIYVYNPDLGYTTSYASGIQSDPTGISDVIPMGQGFYVQATSPTTTLVAQESNKVTSSAPLLRTMDNIGSVIRLKVQDGNGLSDNAAIRFHSDATTGFDGKLDAHKLFGSPGKIGSQGPNNSRTAISTRAGSSNEDYSINSLPYAITQNAVIPVLVMAPATGQYTISGVDLQNLPNSCVILKDKKDNSTHDLKAGAYACTISDTTSTPRFELTVCADIAMSVDEQKITTEQAVLITTDANGAVVKFNLDRPERSVITVTNLMGQKVIDPRSLTVDRDIIYLPLEEKHQLLFITVTTDNNKISKKIVR